MGQSLRKSSWFKSLRIPLALVVAVVPLLSGMLAGCQDGEVTPPPTTTVADYTVTYPLTIQDQTGKSFTFTKAPTKIVSLSPGNTEIAFALGLDNSIIGDTTYCDYPVAAQSKPKMGGFSTANNELIVAAQPDLILTSNIHLKSVVGQLESLLPGTAVFTLNPKTLQDVLDAMILVGRITDHLEQATTAVDALQARMDAVTAKIKNLTESQKPKVLYVLYPSPLMSVGPDTPQNELIGLAGGISISRDMPDGYPTVSIEVLVAANPGIIITSGMGTALSAKEEVLNNPQLADIAAVKNNKVLEVDGNIVQRMGPRLWDGLEALAKLIHPELFS